MTNPIPSLDHISTRIETPYSGMTTPEVVAARDSLSALIVLDDDASDGSLGDLVIWATIELAERLSAFVQHTDGAMFGLALESLAYDLGIVRGPYPRSAGAPPPKPPATEPPPFAMRGPVPLRRVGRHRG